MKTQIGELERYIQKLSLRDEPLNDEMSLRDDLGIDSLRMVEAVIFIEEHFGIELSDDDLNMSKLDTVGDLKKMTESYLE